jgi:putative ABC transport system permease protein
MDTLLQDIRYGIRRLAKNPGFALTAALALALGIGANTAIFSAVNAVLLTPLPFAEPQRLVWVWERDTRTTRPRNPVSPVSYAAFRARTDVFEAIGSSRDAVYNLTGSGEPETIIGYRFSESFFRVLGRAPLLGRTFLAEEDQPGAPRVVVLSHKLWTRRFAADPKVVGRPITLNGESHTVIGVMPPGFQHPSFAELWTPLSLTPEQAQSRDLRILRLVARLRPGVGLDQAQAAVDEVQRRLARQHPDTHGGWGAVVNPIESRYTADIKPALLVLLGAVGFVLLIACANVANLLLARASARRRELALRSALGASRLRLVRQLLIESVLLATLGGALGTLSAYWSLDWLLALFPRGVANLAIPRLEQIRLDTSVLGFTALLTVGTAILFGLAPALHSSRLGLVEALRPSVRGGSGHGGGRLRGGLVVAEVAIALVLVTGGMLMVRSFRNLRGGDLGFEPRGLLTARLSLPGYRYRDPAQRLAFVERVLSNVGAIPGVEAVAATPYLPLSGWYSDEAFRIEGQPPVEPGREPQTSIRVVNEGYFQAMRIPVRKGRAFAGSDGEQSPRVAVINETMARRYFAGEDPLGRRIHVRLLPDTEPDDPRTWHEIVGVVGDVRHHGLARPPEPETYFPYRQDPVSMVCLAIRSPLEPKSLADAVRGAIWAVDGEQPVFAVMTYEQLAADSVAVRRISTQLLGSFAAVALLLAALGIYAVMAYAVAQRTQEVGVRVALGATARDVVGMVLGQGLRLAGLGSAIGLAASLALTRLLGSLLWGVSPTDPVSFATVLATIGAVAVLACVLPAFRAARVDPMAALRYE